TASRKRLLRATEEPYVGRLSEDVALHSGEYAIPGLERIRPGGDVEPGVERIDLEDGVVLRPVGGGARTAVDRSGRADLERAVRQALTAWKPFLETRHVRRDVPDDPVDLVLAGTVAGDVNVVHVKHEALRALRDVRPRQRWGRALTGRCALGVLTVADRDITPDGESGRGQRHRGILGMRERGDPQRHDGRQNCSCYLHFVLLRLLATSNLQ